MRIKEQSHHLKQALKVLLQVAVMCDQSCLTCDV
jgi:hypothetical protein